MTDIPSRGLLAHWVDTEAPAGRLYDRSPEDNHGAYGPTAKWVWFTNPRAIRHVGSHDRTYVGYLGGTTGRDIVVGTYDHDTRTYVETTLATDVSPDDHVGPAVFARNDGHLIALWSEHDGPWIKYRITDDPEDADTFGPVHHLDGEALCYPNPVQPGDEPGAPLYLFYRDRAGTGDGHPYYRVSLDGGASFSDPTRMVTAPEGHYSVYWMAAERDGEVHLFFTDAEGPSTGQKWNVAYAQFDDGTLTRSDGGTIAEASDLPIAPDDLEVIYDCSESDKHDAWIWDSGVDADGHPAVAYVTFPSAHEHTYWHARYDGEEWIHRKIVEAGRYVGADPVTGYFAGGMAMPTQDPDVVYASVTEGGNAVLKRFELGGYGREFTSETITTRAVSDNFRPVVPENRSADVPVVWLAGAYNHLDGSQTSLRGVPGRITSGGPLRFDGHRGVSLGIDCYGADVFERGLTIAVAFEPRSLDRPRTVLDFGGSIRLRVGDDGQDAVTATLKGTSGSARCNLNGVVPDQKYCAVCWWDGDTVRLSLQEEKAATDFDERLALDEQRSGWAIGKPGHFDGVGFDGKIRRVALYNRPLSTDERERLRNGIEVA
jgi:hypothetical protein